MNVLAIIHVLYFHRRHLYTNRRRPVITPNGLHQSPWHTTIISTTHTIAPTGKSFSSTSTRSLLCLSPTLLPVLRPILTTPWGCDINCSSSNVFALQYFLKLCSPGPSHNVTRSTCLLQYSHTLPGSLHHEEAGGGTGHIVKNNGNNNKNTCVQLDGSSGRERFIWFRFVLNINIAHNTSHIFYT